MTIYETLPLVPTKNAAAIGSPFLQLFALTDPQDGPILDVEGRRRTLRATSNPSAIIFGTDLEGAPIRWEPWDLVSGGITTDFDGSIHGITLTVSNLGAIVSTLYDLNNRFRKHIVRLLLPHQEHLDKPNAAYVVKARVASAEVRYGTVVLSLSSHDFGSQAFPSRFITRECTWTYRDENCGFHGDPTNSLGACTNLLSACRRRGQWQIDNGEATSFLDATHPYRYGGYFALPAGGFRA